MTQITLGESHNPPDHPAIAGSSTCVSPPSDGTVFPDRPTLSITKRMIREMWEALLSLVYPPHCLACRAPLEDGPGGLCPTCWERLEMIEGPVCDRCGCPSRIVSPVCENCRDKAFRFARMRCLAPFGPEIQDLVHGLKYQGRVSVARDLGRRLGYSLSCCGFAARVDLLHPVPLHGARRRERGYNQSTLIARAVSETLHIPVRTGLLSRTRQTVTQTGLDQAARAENVKDAFRVRKVAGVSGMRILLVDDVITTGATCSACADALLAAGAREVSVAALASPYFDAQSGPQDQPGKTAPKY